MVLVAMTVNPSQFGEQFGMSKDEESKIAGRALGANIFDSMEEAAFGYKGGYRDNVVTDAWQDVNTHWSDDHAAGNIRPRENAEQHEDADEYPIYHHDLGDGYSAQYPIGSMYATIYKDDAPLDAVNMSTQSSSTAAEARFRNNPRNIKVSIDESHKNNLENNGYGTE